MKIFLILLSLGVICYFLPSGFWDGLVATILGLGFLGLAIGTIGWTLNTLTRATNALKREFLGDTKKS